MGGRERVRRALVVERPGEIALVERASLVPAAGEVLVRPAFCGLCGTDLELLRGDIDPAFVRYPLTLGHEWSGTVVAAADDLAAIAVGDRCVGEGIIPCGRCGRCRSGATNVCETYDELGFTREGGAGDEILVPAAGVHRLDAGVSLVDAALVEPSAVVVRGLEKVNPPIGSRVLVIGDGTIGLLSALFVRLWSPAEVVVRGLRPEQAELAAAVGADRFELDGSGAGEYDLVIEAAGTPETAGAAVASARRGGLVLLLGLPPAGTTLQIPADSPVNNDLSIVASFGYTTASWTRVVSLVNAGQVRPGVIVSHRFPLESWEQALAALSRPDGARGKVLLEIAGGD
jgi:2-desacetyl-2-hydroxyethyl bacteriochlorophyllide A dehydrogenase